MRTANFASNAARFPASGLAPRLIDISYSAVTLLSWFAQRNGRKFGRSVGDRGARTFLQMLMII